MWSDSKRRLGNCGGVARAKPVINCVTPGGSMCAAGGGTTGANYAGWVWAHAPGGSKQPGGLASGRDRQPADGAFERHSSSLWIPLNLTQFHQNLKFKKPTIEQCRALLAASTLSSIIDSDGSPHAQIEDAPRCPICKLRAGLPVEQRRRVYGSQEMRATPAPAMMIFEHLVVAPGNSVTSGEHPLRITNPADFTVLTIPKRFAVIGDPHAAWTPC